MSRLSCGCYTDSRGILCARCPTCNGNSARDAIELVKAHGAKYYPAQNAKKRARRAEFKLSTQRDGSVRAHRQSEGGPCFQN